MNLSLLMVERLYIWIHSTEGRRTVVKDVNLAVRAGEPLTLIGETGSGKTLVAQAILNLLPEEMRAYGSISFKGCDILNMKSRVRKQIWGQKIFLFPQEPILALNPTMQAIAQVKEIFQWVMGLNRKLSLKAVVRILDTVGLNPEQDARRYPHQLSGGMRQRLLTAMAMAEPADLIVADEPTKGLDFERRNAVVAQLDNLVKKGKSLVTITHDLEVARMLEGWLAVMYGGCVVEQGPCSQVLDRPLHPYTKALLASLPANGLRPIPYKVNRRPTKRGCVFADRCTLAEEACFEQEPESRWAPGKSECRCTRSLR
ncbi:MAG: ABC transporter ATP-binding protein [Deltaproteobacteria bacterium]|nr:ABC transporter ATP-binding protein [Deltaproteobacteria bacterium]